MKYLKNEKKYIFIAAICYALYVVYDIINMHIFPQVFNYGLYPNLDYIYLEAMIFIAVSLFIRNKKLIIASTGISAILYATIAIVHSSLELLNSNWYTADWTRYNTDLFIGWFYFACVSFAYAAVVVLVVLSLKSRLIVKKLWFIPALVLYLGYIGYWLWDVHWGYSLALMFSDWKFLNWRNINNYIISVFTCNWKFMIVLIIEFTALFFIGMWIRDADKCAQNIPANEYATFNPQAVHKAISPISAAGGADKLTMYKELLESGTITQEEFDAKKKAILGL